MNKTIKKGDTTITVEIDKNGYVVPNTIMEVDYPDIKEKFRKIPVKAGGSKAITIKDQFEAVMAFRGITEVFHRIRIGDRIKELREAAGLSQKELAEKCDLRQQHIARVELGKYSTGIDILSKIAAALGVRLDFVE